MRDNFQGFSGSNSVNKLSTPFTSQNEDKQPAIGNFVQSLNSVQYHELMSMLSTPLASSSTASNQDSNSISHTAGICYSLSVNPIFSSKDFWIVDSGATKHVCSIADAFVNLRTIDGSNVTLPNHTQIPVKMCGDVILGPTLVLHDVLFVPQFKFNLLSVSALTIGSQLTLSFFHDGFIIQEAKTKKMIAKGDRVHNLYVLVTKTLNYVSNAFVNNVSVHVWHNRLGHLSFKRLDCLKNQLTCDVTNLNKHMPCYSCPLAKQRRLSFESNNKLSNNLFDLVHSDIWGPYQVTSHSGR